MSELLRSDAFFRIIDLPKIEDKRGNLSLVETLKHIPFGINRVFWIYDVPGGQKRGGHAYYAQQEFIIALSGSFEVYLTDGVDETSISLNRSYYGLYVPKLVWRRMENFSTNAVALVVSSSSFDTSDYIRDHNEFINLVKGARVKGQGL